MIGDIILLIKLRLKQLFCIHIYKENVKQAANQTFLIKECIKCGRSKVKEI